MATKQLFAAVPFYAGLTAEGPAGHGVRWPAGDGAAKAPEADLGPFTLEAPGPEPAPTHGQLRLGSWRSLWAAPEVRISPSLQFLHPGSSVELAPDDARRLGIEDGVPVEVAQNGTRCAGARRCAAPCRPARSSSPTRPRSLTGRARGGPPRVTSFASTVYAEDWWIQLIKAVIIFTVGLSIVPVILIAERKLLGRFQSRYGPNRVGPYGLLQPIADIGKLAGQGALAPAHLGRRAVRARADPLDPHRGRRAGDHPLRPRGRHLRHAGRALRHRRQHRPAVPVRVRRHRLLRPDARRLGLGLEVLVPGRDARRRAAHLLRGRPRAWR